jgi:GAF domain-containing protein
MRTRELAQSVEELRALGEVSQAVNSTLDLQTVLDTIVAKAVQLSSTDAGTIFVFNEAAGQFEARANYGMGEDIIGLLQQHHAEQSDWLTRATAMRQAVQDADLRNPSVLPQVESLQNVVLEAGYLARIFIPLLGADRIVGAPSRRRELQCAATRAKS